jgi:hypothetical protein
VYININLVFLLQSIIVHGSSDCPWVDDDISPSHSSIGNNNSLGPIVSSHSGSVDWVSSISSPSVSSYSGLVDLASSISLILHTVNARMRTP